MSVCISDYLCGQKADNFSFFSNYFSNRVKIYKIAFQSNHQIDTNSSKKRFVPTYESLKKSNSHLICNLIVI